jgi:hypothetical protein
MISRSNRSWHARLQLFLAVGVRGVAHGALVVAELVIEAERVFPVELGARHDGLRIMSAV